MRRWINDCVFIDNHRQILQSINTNPLNEFTVSTLLQNNINNNSNPLLNSYLNDDILVDFEWSNPLVEPHFYFLRRSTITSFFAVNLVDMPVCFKKSKSLYSKTFEIPIFKFTNLIMRHGKREQVIKNVTYSFTQCFHQVIRVFNHPDFIHWHKLYVWLNSETTNRVSDLPMFFPNISLKEELPLHAGHKITTNGFFYNTTSFLKNLLFEKLLKYSPLFSFYIRRIDKSIRKNSRGKSGKYMIIWKYVPVYKRLYVTLRWFLKDLKFQKLKTFSERLVKTLEIFLLTPHLSFICKLRKFTNVFVFKNYKKTLLKTLKSTS